MKLTRILLGVAVLFIAAVSARAQDDVHSPQEQLDFARKLRDKGYLDLAMEYLDAMNRNPPAALQHMLQFELAKTRLMLARGLDPEDRLSVVEQARSELTEFLKKFGAAPEAAIVRADLKRLTGEQAKANLSLALRQRGLEAQQEKAEKAKEFFRLAGTEIEAAMKDLQTDEERNQASFDLAVNQMELARCFINTNKDDVRSQRVAIVDKARKMFEALAKKDAGKVGLSSRAWLIKVCSEDEGSEPLVSNKYYEELKNLMVKDAEDARRLARYFQMVRIPRMNSPLSNFERYKKVQAEAEAWMKAYPAHLKTPIGYGVRYELANAMFNEALLSTKDPQRQATLYGKAQDILYSLNESDNDLIGKVSELRSKIARVHLAGKTEVGINDLGTFDLCYIRSGIELDRVQNVAKQMEEARDDLAKKKLEKKLVQHLRTVTQALSRALALADNRTPRYALDNVRFDLLAAYAYLESEGRTRTPYRTAVYGEAIGAANPPGKHSAAAVEQAIKAYARIYDVDKSPGTRERLRSLALLALSPERQKLWEKKSVISTAHYQLALLEQNEATQLFAEVERLKDNPDAVKNVLKSAREKYLISMDHLRKLPKDQPGDMTKYVYAQSKAVFLALEVRDKVPSAEEKKFYRDEARKSIAALPPLPEGVHATAVGMYFHAKMEESKFLYEDAALLVNKKDAAGAMKKYEDMSQYLGAVAKELANPAVHMEEARRDQLAYYIATMEKYAIFGQADFAYRAGNYDKVLEQGLAGKVVDFVLKEAEKEKVVRLKDYQITGQILGLALRANVQKGKIDEARKVMKVLENLKDVKDNALVDTGTFLGNLVSELDAQIHALHKAGDKAALKRTQANFTEFLDALVKQGGKLERKDLFFLARCYDTLEKHDKAAELYGQYPPPKILNVEKKAKDKFSEDEERELQSYCYAQVMLAKQLRLSKKFAEAKKILDDVSAVKNARQMLHIEREQIYLLEETGLFGTAITRWGGFMASPVFKGKDLSFDPEKKKIYFDAYYHMTFCWYKYSQLDKVKAAGKEVQFLVKAADYIVRLETSMSQEGWQLIGHRFRDLLQTERPLSEAYMKQKTPN